jgi:IS30 family transposase
MENLIAKLYYSPETGYISSAKRYEKAKHLNPKITRKLVNEWYSKQEDIQQHKRQKDKFEYYKIASNNPDSWQIDLMFYEKKTILTAININSRIGYADLLPNKSAAIVEAALKRFFKKYDISIITSDNGKEFLNNKVSTFMDKNKIEHFNNEAGDHHTMGKIERFAEAKNH